jgi:hypothetical protein
VKLFLRLLSGSPTPPGHDKNKTGTAETGGTMAHFPPVAYVSPVTSPAAMNKNVQKKKTWIGFITH